MATKVECLQRAAELDAQAAQATDHAATLAVVFGGSDAATIAAFDEVARSHARAAQWRQLAGLHPKTRAAMIRSWAK